MDSNVKLLRAVSTANTSCYPFGYSFAAPPPDLSNNLAGLQLLLPHGLLIIFFRQLGHLQLIFFRSVNI